MPWLPPSPLLGLLLPALLLAAGIMIDFAEFKLIGVLALEDAGSAKCSRALLQASEAGYGDLIAPLIEKGADINAKDITEGRTPLMLAAKLGHEDIVELLLQKGADVNAKSIDGCTALILASGTDKGIAELLIRKGADVNAKTDWESTALSIASRSGHEEIVKLLTRNGAKE